MKKLTLIALALFGLAANAGWTTAVYTATVSGHSEAQSVISGINSGRIYVHGCSGQQEVYAYSLNDNSGSFVRSADGSFRQVSPKAQFKVRCSE